MNVEVIGRCARVDGPCFTLPLARDYLHFHFVLLKDFDFIVCILLISRRNHLILALQIDPQLEAQTIFIERSRHLRVNNTPSCSHPLQITRSNFSLMTLEIFMIEVALLHVSDSLEATVRVIREASWKSDFEIIKHEEGIEISQVLVANNADDLGAFAFVDPSWFEDERHTINQKIGEDDAPFHLYQNFWSRINRTNIKIPQRVHHLYR